MISVHKTTKILVSCVFCCLLTTGCKKADLSWDQHKLKNLQSYGNNIGTTSFILITDGKIVTQWGDMRTPTPVHSVRKAILSALVGQHLGEEEGKIDLQATLGELGIDDYPDPLSENQKKVQVIHLIKSVSGVNHTAAAETPGMTEAKSRVLGTEENEPGSIWAYNNWDYNVLTTIFEQQTGMKILEALRTGLVEPMEMRDFVDQCVFYNIDSTLSIHAKAGFALSTRDMANFGLLYLQRGCWNGKHLIPEEWIDRITNDYSPAGKGLNSGHGYLWWVPCDEQANEMGIPEGTYFASGFAGQRIVVIPAWNTVFVHKVNSMGYEEGFYQYLNALDLEQDDLSDPEKHFYDFILLIANPDRIILQSSKLKKVSKKYTFVTGEEFQKFFKKLLDAHL